MIKSSVASNLEFIKSMAACSAASDASYSKFWQLPMLFNQWNRAVCFDVHKCYNFVYNIEYGNSDNINLVM